MNDTHPTHQTCLEYEFFTAQFPITSMSLKIITPVFGVLAIMSGCRDTSTTVSPAPLSRDATAEVVSADPAATPLASVAESTTTKSPIAEDKVPKARKESPVNTPPVNPKEQDPAPPTRPPRVAKTPVAVVDSPKEKRTIVASPKVQGDSPIAALPKAKETPKTAVVGPAD
jgi:hypothetical protein